MSSMLEKHSNHGFHGTYTFYITIVRTAVITTGQIYD